METAVILDESPINLGAFEPEQEVWVVSEEITGGSKPVLARSKKRYAPDILPGRKFLVIGTTKGLAELVGRAITCGSLLGPEVFAAQPMTWDGSRDFAKSLGLDGLALFCSESPEIMPTYHYVR